MSLVTFIDSIREYAVFYIMPFYLVIGFYVALVLGWFFSTDYYDKIYNTCDTGDDNFWCVHVVFIMMIIIIALMTFFSGLKGVGTLFVSFIMWMGIVIPLTCRYLMKLHMYLRKKRGKA